MCCGDNHGEWVWAPLQVIVFLQEPPPPGPLAGPRGAALAGAGGLHNKLLLRIGIAYISSNFSQHYDNQWSISFLRFLLFPPKSFSPFLEVIACGKPDFIGPRSYLTDSGGMMILGHVHQRKELPCHCIKLLAPKHSVLTRSFCKTGIDKENIFILLTAKNIWPRHIGQEKAWNRTVRPNCWLLFQFSQRSISPSTKWAPPSRDTARQRNTLHVIRSCQALALRARNPRPSELVPNNQNDNTYMTKAIPADSHAHPNKSAYQCHEQAGWPK